MLFSMEEEANKILSLWAADGYNRKPARSFVTWNFGARASPSTIKSKYDTSRRTGNYANNRPRVLALNEDVRTYILAFVSSTYHAKVLPDANAEEAT